MATTLLQLATDQFDDATTAVSDAQADVATQTAAVASATTALRQATGALDDANAVIAALRTSIAVETNLAEIATLTAELATQTTAARALAWSVLTAKKTLGDAQAELALAQSQLVRAQAALAAATKAKTKAETDDALRAKWKTAAAGVTAVADATALLADAGGDYANAKTHLADELLPGLGTLLDNTLLVRAAAELSTLSTALGAVTTATGAVSTALTAGATGGDDTVADAELDFEAADAALSYAALRAAGDYAKAIALLDGILAAPAPAAEVQAQVTAAHDAWADAVAASDPGAAALLNTLELTIQDEVWALIGDFVSAERLLQRVAAAGAPATVTTSHASAEQALVAAMEARAAKAAAVQSKRDDLSLARAKYDVLLAARDARVAARLRGDDA